jgi:hypothetical protein
MIGVQDTNLCRSVSCTCTSPEELLHATLYQFTSTKPRESGSLLTLLNMDNCQKLEKGTAAKQNRFSKSIITLVEKDHKQIPVYWTHYASWRAIANFNLQRLGTVASSIQEGSLNVSPFSPCDFAWTKLSLELLQDVNAQLPGIYRVIGSTNSAQSLTTNRRI